MVVSNILLSKHRYERTRYDCDMRGRPAPLLVVLAPEEAPLLVAQALLQLLQRPLVLLHPLRLLLVQAVDLLGVLRMSAAISDTALCHAIRGGRVLLTEILLPRRAIRMGIVCLLDISPTVGFHNFDLRIFNLRVSNPDKLIVDVFLTRCRISMCQGLGPNKYDEISEIDRIARQKSTPQKSSWIFSGVFQHMLTVACYNRIQLASGICQRTVTCLLDVY